MRHKLSKLVLISSGAALAWFLDPVSGAERRRQLTEQLGGLTGRSTTGRDPTGGAAQPSMRAKPPVPSEPVGDAALAQAVEAASGEEKAVRPPPDNDDEADKNRSNLRTTW